MHTPATIDELAARFPQKPTNAFEQFGKGTSFVRLNKASTVPWSTSARARVKKKPTTAAAIKIVLFPHVHVSQIVC